MGINSVVDERTRREIYLLPFEARCDERVRGRSWWPTTVSTACTAASTPALTDVLRGEWGFDGVVMSDWFGTHGVAALPRRTRPGDAGAADALGHHLLAAIDAGDVTAHAVEQAAQRVLDLIERTAPSRQAVDGVDDPMTPPRSPAPPRRGVVLLANDGVLPLATAPRLAVIGWRADQPEVQGGGSAQVTPPYVITPLPGITDRAGAATVELEAGRVTTRAAALGGRLLTATDGRARRCTSTTSPPAIPRARHCTARRCPRPPQCGWAHRRPASSPATSPHA